MYIEKDHKAQLLVILCELKSYQLSDYESFLMVYLETLNYVL